MSATITRTTYLPAPASDVWSEATRMPSINREMGPWLKMTYPREVDDLALDGGLEAAGRSVGDPLFPSWILFLGVLPVSRAEVTIVELEPGRRFVEQSKMFGMKLWRHERTIEPVVERDREGCTVTDRITLEPLVPSLAEPLAKVLTVFFGHRHRQLAKRFI